MSELEQMPQGMAVEEYTVEEIGQQLRSIEVITAEVQLRKQYAGAAIIEIGKLLLEAKAQLKHGEWLPWLENEVQFSERSANRFMRLAKEYPKSAMLADLGATKALALLALPDSEREGFAAEKHVVNGTEKTVAEMSSRELEKAIRERNEALAAAEQAAAGQRGAEEAREEMARQMEVVNAFLAEANRKAEQARKELEELKSRPVEVAVQEADPAELEKARKEGEAAAQKKLEKAKADVDKANAAKEKLEKQLEAAKQETERVRLEVTAAEGREKAALERAEKAAKEANVTGDPDMAVFKIWFEDCQTIINKMDGLVKKLAAAGRDDQVARLRAAIKALAKAVGALAEENVP